MGLGGLGRLLGDAEREEVRAKIKAEYRGARPAHRLRLLLPGEEIMPEGLTLIEQEEWKDRHGEPS